MQTQFNAILAADISLLSAPPAAYRLLPAAHTPSNPCSPSLSCCCSTRAVRVSCWADTDGTIEAFSFLRFAHASMQELMRVPRTGPELSNTDLLRKPVPPLSCENEVLVLSSLADACAAQLSRYPSTLAQDKAELASGGAEPGSNKRNCLLLLRGEKEVAHYFIGLAALLVPILRSATFGHLQEWSRQAAVERTGPLHNLDSDILRYLRNVARPLLFARDQRRIATATLLANLRLEAEAAGQAGGPPVAVAEAEAEAAGGAAPAAGAGGGAGGGASGEAGR